jgi:hypothetical protein
VGYSIIDGNQTLMLSWDGSDWSIVDSPNPGTANEILNGVSCASSSWCVAVGATPSESGNKPLIEAWDGSSWSVVESPNDGNSVLQSVSCTSETSCVAGGYLAVSFFGTEMLVQTWDGDTWSTLPNPTSGATGDRIDGASCVSGSWCVGVGMKAGGMQTFAVSLTGPEPEPEPTTTTTTPTDEVIPTFAG